MRENGKRWRQTIGIFGSAAFSLPHPVVTWLSTVGSGPVNRTVVPVSTDAQPVLQALQINVVDIMDQEKVLLKKILGKKYTNVSFLVKKYKIQAGGKLLNLRKHTFNSGKIKSSLSAGARDSEQSAEVISTR